MAKIDLIVNARHNADGSVVPLSIVWSDGRVFAVDKVLEVKWAASIKAGEGWIRYRCTIMEKEIDLFDEDAKWFMEK